MNCSSCGHANRAEALFCEECASPLLRVCASCGSGLRPQAKFCDQCGTPADGAGATTPPAAARSVRDYTPRHLAEKILTSRSAIEGERKRVTVLFADMKGSQELAEHVDPEAWHRILDRFFAILTSGIHRFEGTINQYTGDGIMALFGAPIAHEDHAPRACHAALAVMAELRSFADDLRLKEGLNLSMRIGINTGEVVVGKIGDDLRMDYTAQGHTVGLAARMEQIAEPGRIYLTRNTASLVEGYFRLRDLGAMTVKGTRDPVQVYELEGVGELVTRLDVSRSRGLSRFIGRERESALLSDALRRVQEGQGQVIGVIGNAGIGKSRLCYEFTERCRAQGFAVLRATGVTYGNALPFFPILSLMRGYFGISEHEVPAEARRKVAGTLLLLDPALKDSLPLVYDFMGIGEPGVVVELPPEVRQQRLVDMLGVLCRPGEEHATVVLVEDLHWVDAGSEAFLAKLVEVAPQSRTLLIFNYRPEYSADWLNGHVDCEVSLSALGAAELAELATDLLGHGEGMAELSKRIRERAGGNPFFVEEAVHALAAGGSLEGRVCAYRLVRPVEALTIPDTVQAIIAARIDRLDDREKTVLQHAAVVGREFSEALLAKVMDFPRDELVEALSQLEELGFVNQGLSLTTGQYSFCHPLMQEVTYQSQLNDRRALVHAALAGELEAGIEPDQPVDERSVLLAHHWECAGNLPKAAQWSIQASMWSSFRDLGGALSRARKTIALIDRAPATVEARQLAVSARASLLRLSMLTQVPDDEAETAYAEARSIADEIQDKRALAELLLAYGTRKMNLADAHAAMVYTSEAIRAAREVGARDLEARFRLAILIAYFAVGRLQEGLDLLDESSDGAWSTGPITTENVGSRAFRASYLFTMGRINEARQQLQEAEALTRKMGRVVSWMHTFLVEIAYLAGTPEAATHDAQTAVRGAEDFDSPFFRLIAYRSLAMSHILHEQWRNAIEILERFLPNVRVGQPAHQYESGHLTALAEAYLGAGRVEDSIATAREALDVAIRANMRIWEGRACIQLARALNTAGTEAAHREVAAILDQLEKLIGETGARSYAPFLHEERSRLAAGLGDADGARRELETALRLYREIGADGRAARLERQLRQGVLKVG